MLLLGTQIMSTPATQGLSVIGPPTNRGSLVTTIILHPVNNLLQVVAGDIWQNYVASFLANAPPAAAYLGDTLYVFYASPAQDVPSLLYNTCTGTTWSSESSVRLAQTQTG